MLDLTVLGFDFGMKRIGVAVGKTLINTSQALHTLKALDGVPNWQQLEALIGEWQPDYLIVGLPVNIDNTEQAITFAAKKFAKKLTTRFSIKVILVDERLTTVEARQQLFDEGGYKQLSKAQVDSYAAKLIVEQWMMTAVAEL